MESNIWNIFINISRKTFLISGIIYFLFVFILTSYSFNKNIFSMLDFEGLFVTMGYGAFIQAFHIQEFLFTKPIILVLFYATLILTAIICRNNIGVFNIVLGYILITFLIILPDLLWRVPVFITKTLPQLGIDPRVVDKNLIQFSLLSIITIPVGFIHFFAWTINWIFDWK